MNTRGHSGDPRGQSAVLGLVILIGFVAIASVGLLILAADTTEELEQQTENERIEQAFVELGHKMATSTATGDTTTVIDFAAGEKGAVVKADTGEITIQGGDINETFRVGEIEYEGDDGTRIAYQAGGVFRETGTETQIVSAPPLHYDAAAETFSFPIIKTEDEDRLESGDVTIRHQHTDPHRDASLVKNDTVTITITSKYYRGWAEYFERQAGPTTVRDIETHEGTDEGTVTAELGYLDVQTAFEDGATLSDEYDGFDNANVTMDVAEGSMPELDDEIDDIVDELNTTEHRQWAPNPEDGPWIIDGSADQGPFEDGTYFADEVDLDGEELEFDLSDGNATLVVDGDISIHNTHFKVKNWDEGETEHTLKVYSTGDLDLHTSAMCVESCISYYESENELPEDEVDAARLQVFGTSDMHVDFTGGSNLFEGIIYAASNDYDGDYQVEMQANAAFHGAVVASSMDVHSAAVGAFYDEELREEVIDIYPEGHEPPPQVTYLNIAEHIVDVKSK